VAPFAGWRLPFEQNSHTNGQQTLEQSGEILGYQVILAKKANTGVAAYFDIQHNSARCADVIPVLNAIPEVRRCHGISGETDLIVFVQADSVARLHQIREHLDAHPAIVRIKTHIVLSEWISDNDHFAR
jgi:Lrp/AsnC family leucine-responsive transcriptional regulator